MPAVIGTALVRVIPDTTGFGRAVNSSVHQMSNRFGSSMQKVGRSMTLGVTAPVLALGAASVNAFRAFEDGMLQTQAVTGATADEMAQLDSKAQELGRTTMFSAGQVAEAMGFMGMAGLEVLEIYETIPDVLHFAAAGGMDLQRAADGATNVMSGFGLEVDELGAAMDSMTAVATGSNTSLDQMFHAMSFAAPLAAGLGMDFNETAAAIGIFGNAGIQGSRGGTTINRILGKLATQTGATKEVMDKYGFTAENLEGKMKSLTEVVDMFKDGQLSSADAMAMFEQRGGPGMLALLSQSEEFAELSADATAAWNSTLSETEEIADIKMSGITGQILRMKSAWEGVMIAIARSGLIAVVASLAGAFQKVFEKVAEANPRLLKMFLIFTGIMAMVGPLIFMFGAMFNPISLAIAAIGTLIAWLGMKINSVLSENMFLVAAFIDAWNRFKMMFKLAATVVRDALAEAFGGSESSGDMVENMLLKVVDAMNWLSVRLPGYALKIREAIFTAREWFDKLKDTIQSVRDFMSRNNISGGDVAKGLGTAFGTNAVFKKIISPLIKVFSKVGKVLKPVFKVLGKALKPLLNGLKKLAPVLKKLGPVFKKFGMFLGGKFVGILTKVGMAFKAMGAFMMANPIFILIAVIIAVGVAIWYLWNNSERFRAGVMILWEALKSLGSWLASAGVAAWNWFASAMSWVGATMVTVWQKIVATAQGIWTAIVWYFTLVWTVATTIWNAIATTVTTVASAIWSALVWYWTLVFTTISNILSAIWNWIVNTWNGILNSIIWIVAIILFTVKTKWEEIKTAVIEKVTELKEKGEEIWGEIQGFIEGALGAIGSAIDGVLGFIDDLIGKFGELKNFLSNLDLPNPLSALGDAGSSIVGRFRAQGGLVTRPEFSITGEDGPELILPLSKPGRMAQLLNRYGSAIPGYNSSSGGGEGTAVNTGGNTYNFNGVNLSDALYEIKRRERDELARIRS